MPKDIPDADKMEFVKHQLNISTPTNDQLGYDKSRGMEHEWHWPLRIWRAVLKKMEVSTSL